jgi:hypothetical protein
MSSRYDKSEGTDPFPPPLTPVPEPWGLKRWGVVVLFGLTAAVGIAAAFGLDLCPCVRAVGIPIDSCAAAPAPAPEAPKP